MKSPADNFAMLAKLGLSLSRLAVRAGINRVCIRIYESHWTMRRTRTLMRLAA